MRITCKKKHFRPLLISGHPRCGTGYAADLCNQLGLDIGHERLGTTGISSWMFAVDADENPWGFDAVARTRRAFAWKHLVVPVRNPYDAAASVIRDSQHAPASYRFRRDHILDKTGLDLDRCGSAMEQAIWSIIEWTRMLLDQTPSFIFRIEDQHEELRRFLIENSLINRSGADLNLDLTPKNADKPYQGKRYPKPVLTERDWQRLSKASHDAIAWYCTRFGYREHWF